MGHARMSFLDACRGYHQIAMHGPDQEKTAFITFRGVFCYKVMLFGLKNKGATYQRMITKIFESILCKTMDAYINDMMVKSRRKIDHVKHLIEVFIVQKNHKLRLNTAKGAFGVSLKKFLGHFVTRRGIEANSEHIIMINNLINPKTAKEV